MIMINHNLRVFINVAERGSITQTANELFISQPAVSKAIRNLEEELSVKLFHRNKRSGLALTDVGKEILLLARQMSDAENRMYQTAFRANNFLGGRVRIASMPIVSTVYLAKVFKAFKIKYPFVKIELTEASASEVKKAVEDHCVDFGITSSPFGDLDNEMVIRDEMIAVTAKKRKNGSAINLLETDEPIVFCRSGEEIVSENLRGITSDRSEKIVVEQAATVIAFAEQDIGTGIVSKLVADATPNSLYRYPVVPNISTDIGIVAHDLNDLTPVAMEMKRMIIDFIMKKSR